MVGPESRQYITLKRSQNTASNQFGTFREPKLCPNWCLHGPSQAHEVSKAGFGAIQEVFWEVILQHISHRIEQQKHQTLNIGLYRKGDCLEHTR